MKLVRTVQLGPCLVRIETDDQEVHRQLRYLDHCASQPFQPSNQLCLSARSTQGGFVLMADGEGLGLVASPAEALDRLYTLAYRHAFTTLPESALLLHGATISFGSGRALLVGPPRAGKTTLATRFLLDGVEASGDEYAVLDRSQVSAFPRCFHVKEGTLRMLPALRPLLPELPSVQTASGRVVALQPTDLGLPWVLEPAPLDLILLLEPDHAGPTMLGEITAHELVHALMRQTIVPAGRTDRWIASLSELVSGTDFNRLIVGDLENAVLVIKDLLG